MTSQKPRPRFCRLLTNVSRSCSSRLARDAGSASRAMSIPAPSSTLAGPFRARAACACDQPRLVDIPAGLHAAACGPACDCASCDKPCRRPSGPTSRSAPRERSAHTPCTGSSPPCLERDQPRTPRPEWIKIAPRPGRGEPASYPASWVNIPPTSGSRFGRR